MGQRLLVGCGGVLLMSVLLLAAFSLGVYAGRGNLLDGEAPPIAGPGQQQPKLPDAQPEQPQPALRPALVGRVRSVDPGGLVLGTGNGLRNVLITPKTRFRRQGEQGQPPSPATFEDVQPGVGVAIFGQPSDDGRGLVADVVEILRPGQ